MSDEELSDVLSDDEPKSKTLVQKSTKKASSSGSSSSSSSSSASAKQSDSDDDDGLVKGSAREQNLSDSDHDIDDDIDENEKQEQSTPKRSRKPKEQVPQDEISIQLQSISTKSNKYVELDEETEEKINEARAASLIEEMDKAYDTDYQSSLRNTHSFERLKFLQKLLKLSNDRYLSKALIKQDILERFKKWFGGFSDGKAPFLSVIELILQILKTFNLKDQDFISSGIVTSVRELSLKPDTKASKIRDELLNDWKRGILKAKSGNKYQKSTDIEVDDNLRDTTTNLLFENKQQKAQILANQKRREIKLKQLGIKIKDNSTGPMERQRIYKSVTKIRQKK